MSLTNHNRLLNESIQEDRMVKILVEVFYQLYSNNEPTSYPSIVELVHNTCDIIGLDEVDRWIAESCISDTVYSLTMEGMVPSEGSNVGEFKNQLITSIKSLPTISHTSVISGTSNRDELFTSISRITNVFGKPNIIKPHDKSNNVWAFKMKDSNNLGFDLWNYTVTIYDRVGSNELEIKPDTFTYFGIGSNFVTNPKGHIIKFFVRKGEKKSFIFS